MLNEACSRYTPCLWTKCEVVLERQCLNPAIPTLLMLLLQGVALLSRCGLTSTAGLAMREAQSDECTPMLVDEDKWGGVRLTDLPKVTRWVSFETLTSQDPPIHVMEHVAKSSCARMRGFARCLTIRPMIYCIE